MVTAELQLRVQATSEAGLRDLQDRFLAHATRTQIRCAFLSRHRPTFPMPGISHLNTHIRVRFWAASSLDQHRVWRVRRPHHRAAHLLHRAQIVLSPSRFLTTAPGSVKDDTTIVP
jgi:hypothetical protein